MDQLQSLEELYVLYSACTNMPYLYQHPETYEDLLLAFSDRKKAEAQATQLREEKRPVQILAYKKEQLEAFFTGQYYVGADGVLLDHGAEESVLALSSITDAPNFEKLPNRAFRVRNQSLHVSLIYYMQEARRPIPAEEKKERLKQMEEEVLANLTKATYLAPHHAKSEQKGANGEKRLDMMAVKDKRGNAYQPLFTDAIEMSKLTRGKPTPCLILPFREAVKIKSAQLSGYVINPMGENLILKKEQMEALAKAAGLR